MRRLRQAALVSVLAGLTACSHLDLGAQQAATTVLASAAGRQSLTLPTKPFALRAFVPAALAHTDVLTVYIEGDGLAWLSANTPSRDPTPIHALALQLALSDSQGVYLARPCQYLSVAALADCPVRYWTSHRFAPEVIAASNAAISQLMQRVQAKRLILVGYSGGAAVAALVAAQRQDVDQLISIAGNLDHAQWTRRHALTALTGSLNPAEAWASLQTLRQTHFIGGKDRVISLDIAQAYRARFAEQAPITLTVVPEATHRDGWLAIWPSLIHTLRP